MSVEISDSWNKPAIVVQDFTVQIIVLDQLGVIALPARLVPIKLTVPMCFCLVPMTSQSQLGHKL